jgi:hypothetical protein
MGTLSHTPDIASSMIVNSSPKNARHTSLGLKTQYVLPVSQLSSAGRAGGLFPLGHTLNPVAATSDRKFYSHRGGSVFAPAPTGGEDPGASMTLN